MERDVVYSFDKKSHIGIVLGEIQTNFNMSFVIDGTKDSCSMILWSKVDTQIEPYTIIYHKKTSTWWVVQHDKVERRQADNGFIYIHEIQLLGAIELFNARDLTDCAFNDKTYTINDFLKRLIKLSNLESFTDYNSNEPNEVVITSEILDTSKVVEFIKTFENYTLLSAIREFLDAYNSCAKLSFGCQELSDGTLYLYEIELEVLTKTGDRTLTSHNISHFDDVRETRTLDKESFGSCVVSNAENVISSLSKTFPTVGTIRPVATEYLLKAENAQIRLPSKVYKANWLKMCYVRFLVNVDYVDTSLGDDASYSGNLRVNPFDDNSIDTFLDNIKNTYVNVYINTNPSLAQDLDEDFEQNRARIKEEIRKAATVTLYEGTQIEPVSTSEQVIQAGTAPYVVYADYYAKNVGSRPFLLVDKKTKELLKDKWTGISWEKGSNIIDGFDGFEPVPNSGRNAYITIRNLKYTDLLVDDALPDVGQENFTPYEFYSFHHNYSGPGANFMQLQIRLSTTSYHPGFRDDIQWIVNYIPMSDIKIKVDNTRDRNDIQLFNQNGKITDNYALSKLLHSYANEISSDTITKYKCYKKLMDVPSVGSFVIDGNKTYVINNVSLTFTQNEYDATHFGYFIEGEFTMSQYCSTKSLMVNPNTNIRDYGIPQNYNVKRKQLYRDFYELNYAADSNANYNTPYIPTENIFHYTHTPNATNNYIAVMRMHYQRTINSNYYCYYQLETTRYNLDKMFYVILDFQDNNIIGYGAMNVWSGFVISGIFQGLTDTLVTPISYTDSKGQVKDIDIKLCTNEQITTVYGAYIEANSGQAGYSAYKTSGKTMYNYCCFIPAYIYNRVEETLSISEPNYKKDALEVPVFEYACQVDDTEEVLIGDNILKEYDDIDIVYFYSYMYGDNLTQDSIENSDYEGVTKTVTEVGPVTYTAYSLSQSCSIEYGTQVGAKKLEIKLYANTQLSTSNSAYIPDTWTNGTQQSFVSGKDYAIFRHAYNKRTDEETVDLLFICKKVKSSSIHSNALRLFINYYKLK